MKRGMVLIMLLTMNITQLLCKSINDLINEGERITIVNGELDLSRKELTSLDGLNTVNGIQNLEILMLGGNALTNLEEWQFYGLTNLRELYLDNNSLSALDENAFSGLTNLKYLNLSNNSFDELPTKIFNGLASLRTLELWANQLTTLPGRLFNGLTNLRRLDIASARLETVPEGIFRDLTNLEWLNLSDNQFKELLEGVFSNLKSLLALRLDKNQLTTLPEWIFADLTNLQGLSLNNNRLTTLPREIFTNLKLKGIVVDAMNTLQGLDLFHNLLPRPEVAWIRKFCQERNIYLNISDQQGPIVLEPNVTQEEYEAFKKEYAETHGGEAPVCPVCLDEKTADEEFINYKTSCSPVRHWIHTSCLQRWVNQARGNVRCPECSQPLNIEEPAEEPLAYHASQKKNISVAKQTRKRMKNNHIHVAHRTKKSKAMNACA